MDTSKPTANTDLRPEAIPANDADQTELVTFALSFDGYSYWGSFERCSEVAQAVQQQYIQDGTLPSSLVALRTALFFEQRAARHMDAEFLPRSNPYLGTLLAAIRLQATERQT